MPRRTDQLREDALRIWRAGVAAVHPARLMPDFAYADGRRLWVGDEEIDVADAGRIAIVGGGKAAGAMVAALEQALGAELLDAKRVTGVVNVPEGAVVDAKCVDVRAVRPIGVNEPTAAAVAGTEEMLRLVAGLGPRDLCLAVLTGGGSALLPAPLEGFSLDDKIVLTRELSARGATIHELNAVRRALSRFKGGGLARACSAGRLIALVLSDVLGDDLATIASGPTVDASLATEAAIGMLARFQLDGMSAGRRAIEVLRRQPTQAPAATHCRVTNVVIGNNATAVDAAGVEAERLGYSHAMLAANEPEGAAEDVGRHLAQMAERMRGEDGPDCLISGGEPTVRLAPEAVRGKGGRNQQLCLAALAALDDWSGLALVSGGTDGEDGPTDAAGAWVDEGVVSNARQLEIDPRDFLARNDAYRFFERAGGLLKTGATQTNVCDLRVVTVGR
jgi:glycerate 2-kinase